MTRLQSLRFARANHDELYLRIVRHRRIAIGTDKNMVAVWCYRFADAEFHLWMRPVDQPNRFGTSGSSRTTARRVSI